MIYTHEKSLINNISKSFKSMGNEIGIFLISNNNKGYEQKSLSDGIRKIVDKFHKVISSYVYTVQETNMKKGFLQEQKIASKSDLSIGWNDVSQKVYNYLNWNMTINNGYSSSSIKSTTRDKINTIIGNGIRLGQNYGEMATNITNQITAGVFSKSRAEMIAVNQLANAYEYARRESVTELEKKYPVNYQKKWSTVHDDKVTVGCKMNENMGWIIKSQPFQSGDFTAPRRGNPRCRCRVDYRLSFNGLE